MKRLTAALFLLIAGIAQAQAQPISPSPSTVLVGNRLGSPCRYPDSAFDAHEEGNTKIFYRGKDDGTVADVTVVNSSGSADLDAAAIKCVSNWRFNPTTTGNAYVGNHQIFISWVMPVLHGEQRKPPLGVVVTPPTSCDPHLSPLPLKPGVSAKAVISFRITTEGTVENLAVAESSGNADLDKAALACAATRHYRPALKNGQPIAIDWKVSVVFRAPTSEPAAPQTQPSPGNNRENDDNGR